MQPVRSAGKRAPTFDTQGTLFNEQLGNTSAEENQTELYDQVYLPNSKKKKEEHLSPVNLNLNVLSTAKLLKQPICAAILVANATAGYYYKRKKITLRTSSVLFPSSPLAIHRAPWAVILLLLDEK